MDPEFLFYFIVLICGVLKGEVYVVLKELENNSLSILKKEGGHLELRIVEKCLFLSKNW